jgi:hypothetical protein
MSHAKHGWRSRTVKLAVAGVVAGALAVGLAPAASAGPGPIIDGEIGVPFGPFAGYGIYNTNGQGQKVKQVGVNGGAYYFWWDIENQIGPDGFFNLRGTDFTKPGSAGGCYGIQYLYYPWWNFYNNAGDVTYFVATGQFNDFVFAGQYYGFIYAILYPYNCPSGAKIKLKLDGSPSLGIPYDRVKGVLVLQ